LPNTISILIVGPLALVDCKLVESLLVILGGKELFTTGKEFTSPDRYITDSFYDQKSQDMMEPKLRIGSLKMLILGAAIA
jgi:hypothetical protein